MRLGSYLPNGRWGANSLDVAFERDGFQDEKDISGLNLYKSPIQSSKGFTYI